MSAAKQTPLMSQYVEMKKKHPDAVLLFRVGDFYETFSEDAITASEILGITLTKRGNGTASAVPLAGFPHHALDTYLPKLVRAGKRVAICEQLEDPKLTKKLVKRGITELVTPGVNTNDTALQARRNNFLAGFHIDRRGKNVGAAFLDITTGEFLCAQGSPQFIDKLLNNIGPKELLHMQGLQQYRQDHFSLKCSTFQLDDWVYTDQAAEERLLRQFNTHSLKGFGVEDIPLGVIAAGSLLHYLDITGHTNTSHISTLGRIDENLYVHLDKFTVRNLELVAPIVEEGKSLLDIIDLTVSPPGARMLRQWLLFPLTDPAEISRRQDVVESFFKIPELRNEALMLLKEMGDMGRLASKVATGRANPRDLLSLAQGAQCCAQLKQLLLNSELPPLVEIGNKMADTSQVAELIRKYIAPDPPVNISKPNYINSGIDEVLDEYRRILSHSNDALQNIVRRESEITGITSLKIGYNNVFGYYIEVRNTHKEKVPENWIRRQTLTQAERYITPELKDYEQKILEASQNISAKEQTIYKQLLGQLVEFLPQLLSNTELAARCDVLLSFARAAEEYNYVRPVVDDSMLLEITNGRHPVIERRLPPGDPYIANSVVLDPQHRQIMMITGPNMSGKSALLRQTAIIAIMAQTGSFVPAETAHIGIIDKIFTRVGASDNISQGESTFMVEMSEAASILNNMSPRSLVLFDELGRGTSTYDGISIARSIVEFIHNNKHANPKTLFATHYHELNEMEADFPRIVNYNVSVKEIGGKVVFVRKLERGGSQHSFGIHVARLAGMPKSIVSRAEVILEKMERDARNARNADNSKEQTGNNTAKAASSDGVQLSLFQLDDPLLAQIRDRLLSLDVDNLTPLMALTTLHDLQSLLTGK